MIMASVDSIYGLGQQLDLSQGLEAIFRGKERREGVNLTLPKIIGVFRYKLPLKRDILFGQSL